MTRPTAPSAASPADEPGAPAARLASLAVGIWDSQMAAHPVYATALGDRRFDDPLRDNDPGALAADVKRLGAWRQQAEAIDVAGLGPAGPGPHPAPPRLLRV